MGETINSPKGVTSGVPERAFPTPHVAPVTNYPQITGNQSYTTVSEPTIQNI